MEETIKLESAHGENEKDVVITEPKAMITSDKVSSLQQSVDKMALSMFNALRLLPQTLGDDAHEDNVASIKSLAKDVLLSVKETDLLINDLPGLDKTEEKQLEEMKRLQIQCEDEAQSLRQVAEEAERWMERANDSLRVISETRLRH